MSIFNSLGSNYTLESVLETFSAGNRESHALLLKKFLEERYGGNVTLVYKGREAMRLALRAINKKKTSVAICGYTCYAVYDAVVQEGYDVTYLDVDETLQFSVETLKKAVEKNADIKVVIIQNTLGYPCAIEKIATYCKQKGIVLIEDLAHAIGTTYSDGKEAGTVGDFVILSFSQDKMIDGISGGAVVVRNPRFTIENLDPTPLSLDQQKRDKMYPFYTFLIRKTYGVGLGKGLHVVLKKRKLLTMPMDNLETTTIHTLAHWYSQLIYAEYKQLDKNLKHRRSIANVYAEGLNKKVVGTYFAEHVSQAANLRFPIFVSNREGLIHYLKQKHIYVSDIWYDAPIGPKKYMAKTNYNGQCPIAETIAERIVNLPTHRNISLKDAKLLVQSINEWLTKE